MSHVGATGDPTIGRTVVCLCFVLATLLAGCDRNFDSHDRDGSLSSDESGASNPNFPDSLVGAWVRVYPYVGGADTLVLNADGSASGRTRGIVTEHMPIVYRWWASGASLTLGDSVTTTTAAYQMRGDTLSFGDQFSSVLVRPLYVTPETLALDSAHAEDRAWFGRVTPATNAWGNE